MKSPYAFSANSKVIRRIYFAAKYWVIGAGFRGMHALIPMKAFEPDEAVLPALNPSSCALLHLVRKDDSRSFRNSLTLR